MIFKNEFKWLSNMFMFRKPITVNMDGDNELIQSVENYYQSRKTVDKEVRSRVLSVNPYDSRKLGKIIDLRVDWTDDLREAEMWNGLRYKFTDTFLRLKLIGLLEPIVEDNYHKDTFWGVYKGIGEDRLGKLLTRMRDSIIREENYKKKIHIGNLYSTPMENEDLLSFINQLAIGRMYKPIPENVKNTIYELYRNNLNGFDVNPNRALTIDGVIVADKYERIVLGDYGAYVEIAKSDLKVELTIPKNQEWRLDDQYIVQRNIKLKYIWYEYNKRKVYYQVDTVAYADYKPNHYYISVLEFDKITERKCIKYRCFTANATHTKAGDLVMGLGNALAVYNMYPNIQKRLGKTVTYLSKYGIRIDRMTKVIAFQTKIHYRENSSIDIVKNSFSKLLNNNITDDIGLPFPGINNGKLHENLVVPMLVDLPDNISIWKEKPTMYFTSIGSRSIPDEIAKVMEEFVAIMTSRGYCYRSGGADGSDKKSEAGVKNNLKEVYLPWKGFNDSDSMLYTEKDSDDTIAIARDNHPAYDRLSDPIKRLMNRNVYQVLGLNLNTPSEFVICYTEDGCKSHLTRTSKTGGTGLAISVASKRNIPIFNLGNDSDLTTIKNIIKVLGENDGLVERSNTERRS